MLEDLLDMNRSIKSVGVGGYPEGHPKIHPGEIIDHLKAKIEIASKHGVEIHINSQACYDPGKIANWIRLLKEKGIDKSVFLGIPTPTDMIKLAKISAEIGVGDSIAFLRLTGMGSAFRS